MKSLLPALAIVCLSNCTTTIKSKEKVTAKLPSDSEKVFVIRNLADSNRSYMRLRPLTPCYIDGNSPLFNVNRLPDSIRNELTGESKTTFSSDTMKLHIKGDLCWIEYIIAGKQLLKKKDGSYREAEAMLQETLDTIVIR